MAPPNSNSGKQYIHSLPGDDEGNKNVLNFTEYCTKFDASKVSKLRDIVEDEDVIFLGNIKGKITLFHSPKKLRWHQSSFDEQSSLFLRSGTQSDGSLVRRRRNLRFEEIQRSEKDDIYKV